jgi:hypothetical protein
MYSVLRLHDRRGHYGNNEGFSGAAWFCTHRDPNTEPEKFYPYMAESNISAEYPPTVLVHGTEDTGAYILYVCGIHAGAYSCLKLHHPYPCINKTIYTTVH